jgi:hypothetical protein
MKVKVRKVVDELVGILKTWDNVEAVVLQHFVEKDVYDPNFSVSLDVFRTGVIPSRDAREALFRGARYFDSSRLLRGKDRFILNDLPIRISYKDTDRVDAVLSMTGGEEWLSMERGTYLLHRMATGTVVWTRGTWFAGVLEKLDNLPASFWPTWVESCNRRIDHFLGDMGAAAIKEDQFYFRLSLSSFMKTVAEQLFAINHVFEPGPRDYTASLGLLETLPDGFAANWDSLLRDDPELPADRKTEIAEIMARGIFALNP